jgi:hypothetical protein
LQIAPSGYWRHAARQRNASLLCARVQRDAGLIPDIQRVWQASQQVYGADKVWRQLQRWDFYELWRADAGSIPSLSLE